MPTKRPDPKILGTGAASRAGKKLETDREKKARRLREITGIKQSKVTKPTKGTKKKRRLS